VWVVELCRDLDLAKETFRAQGRGDLVAQHLDGDGAVVSWVAGQEYHRHPAAAELPLERVTGSARAIRRRSSSSGICG